MLKLKLQYFGHLMWRADSFDKTLMLGKIEGRRRRGKQRMRWLDGITDSMDMSLSKLRGWWWTGRPGVLQSMGLQRVGHDWATELNWEVTEEDPEMLRWLSLHLTFFFLFPQLIYWNYFLHWRKDWRWWQPAAGKWWETSLGSRILCGTEGFTQRFHLLPLRIINVHLISRLEACI